MLDYKYMAVHKKSLTLTKYVVQKFQYFFDAEVAEKLLNGV